MIVDLLREASDLHRRTARFLDERGPALPPTAHIWLRMAVGHAGTAARYLEMAMKSVEEQS